MRGYVQVYTGNGKGKTTAALGLALRAVGCGLRVFIAQFIKGSAYSEIKAIKKYLPMVAIKQYGRGCFIKGAPTPEDIQAAQFGLNEIREIINTGEYDIIILDEILVAIHLKVVTLQEIIDIIKNKPEPIELILTGRYAPPEIIELADLVTEMHEVKHYYQKGIKARLGIEY